MFERFKQVHVDTGEVTINAVVGGRGQPLLLLHGYPQTHVIWHKIAPRLAAHFTVVAAGLRGYDDSGKPEGAPDHSNYSKRARDQVESMRQLGFERFYLAGQRPRRARRAFWALWFSIRNVLSFRGAFAAESAGDSVSQPTVASKNCRAGNSGSAVALRAVSPRVSDL